MWFSHPGYSSPPHPSHPPLQPPPVAQISIVASCYGNLKLRNLIHTNHYFMHLDSKSKMSSNCKRRTTLEVIIWVVWASDSITKRTMYWMTILTYCTELYCSLPSACNVYAVMVCTFHLTVSSPVSTGGRFPSYPHTLLYPFNITSSIFNKVGCPIT